MRAATLQQVREVLSSPAAMQFFEQWSRAAGERAQAEEQLEALSTQLSSAEGRVRHALEAAQLATARAEQERRRVHVPGLAAAVRPFVLLEAEALAQALVARAKGALEEAAERRRRVELLTGQASDAARVVEAARAEQERLRTVASTLGGYVGESCLFFADAQVEGGVYLFTLVPVALQPQPLQAFVLHRLAPNAPLGAARAVRDTPSPDVPDLPAVAEASDPMEPPPEAAACKRTEPS